MEFPVEWNVDVDGEGSTLEEQVVDAARTALAMQRDAGSTATVFHVHAPADSAVWKVDLLSTPPEVSRHGYGNMEPGVHYFIEIRFADHPHRDAVMQLEFAAADLRRRLKPFGGTAELSIADA